MEFAKRKGTDGTGDGGSGKRRENRESTEEVEETEEEEQNGLMFEDPFEDEFEDEEFEETAELEDDAAEEKGETDAERTNMNIEEEQQAKKQLWRPNIDKLPEGEELEYDPSAYVMYHSLRVEWPCLSFDFFKDELGENRQRFPLTMYLACGSQADKADRNMVTLLKLSDLHKTHHSADSDEESEDEDLDEDPTIEHANINHHGGVNRLRCMPQTPGVVATLSDTGHAHIYDATASLRSMMSSAGPRASPPSKPAFTFRGHREEGYAVDWSSASAGRLATGDCSGAIHVWSPSSSGAASSWQVDSTPYRGHNGSVEDLQWSPSEATVFISASADRTVRIWDTRAKASQITIQAHADDVNVISWNRSVSYLLASGCDDGSFKVWDLRTVRTQVDPLANFRYHTGAITSIEWAPHDESVLCLSSADNQVTIWDLSVEADDQAEIDPTLADFPPQLLFIHQGQSNVKEIHHHPQIPGVVMTTAEDGFNVFKPAISVS